MAKACQKSKIKTEKRGGWNCHPNTPSLYIILYNVRAKRSTLTLPLA